MFKTKKKQFWKVGFKNNYIFDFVKEIVIQFI